MSIITDSTYLGVNCSGEVKRKNNILNGFKPTLPVKVNSIDTNGKPTAVSLSKTSGEAVLNPYNASLYILSSTNEKCYVTLTSTNAGTDLYNYSVSILEDTTHPVGEGFQVNESYTVYTDTNNNINFMSYRVNSKATYTSLPTVFNPENNNFELVVKFKPTVNRYCAENRCIFHANSSTCQQGLYIGISSIGKLSVRLNDPTYQPSSASDPAEKWLNSFKSVTSSGDDFYITKDTVYWIKVSLQNHILKSWHSTDGINWIAMLNMDTTQEEAKAGDSTYNVVTTDVPVNFQIPTFTNTYLGVRYYQIGQYFFDQFIGDIDTAGCYFKINNDIIWRGAYSTNACIFNNLLRETKREYYKYTNWTQPVLSSNFSSPDMWLEDPHLTGAVANYNNGNNKIETWGTSALSSFSNVYKALDSDTSNFFNPDSISLSSVNDDAKQIYSVVDVCFNNYMKITSAQFSCIFVNGYHCALIRVLIYIVNEDGSLSQQAFKGEGSNTITTFSVNINGNNTKIKRLRICLKPSWNNNGWPCQINEITLTGQKAIVGTSSNYDFYNKVYTYNVLKR